MGTSSRRLLKAPGLLQCPPQEEKILFQARNVLTIINAMFEVPEGPLTPSNTIMTSLLHIAAERKRPTPLSYKCVHWSKFLKLELISLRKKGIT